MTIYRPSKIPLIFNCNLTTMDEDDESPPMLVAANGTNGGDSTLEAGMEDVKIARVPITVITGVYFSLHVEEPRVALYSNITCRSRGMVGAPRAFLTKQSVPSQRGNVSAHTPPCHCLRQGVHKGLAHLSSNTSTDLLFRLPGCRQKHPPQLHPHSPPR